MEEGNRRTLDNGDQQRRSSQSDEAGGVEGACASCLNRQDSGAQVALFWQQHFNESQELQLDDCCEHQGTTSSNSRTRSRQGGDDHAEGSNHGHNRPCHQQDATVDMMLYEKMEEARRRRRSTGATGRLTPARGLSDTSLSSAGGSWHQPTTTSTPRSNSYHSTAGNGNALSPTGSSGSLTSARSTTPTSRRTRSRTPNPGSGSGSGSSPTRTSRRDRRATAHSSSIGGSGTLRSASVPRSNTSSSIPVRRRPPATLSRHGTNAVTPPNSRTTRSRSNPRHRRQEPSQGANLEYDDFLQKTNTTTTSLSTPSNTSRRRTARQIQRRQSLGSRVEEEFRRRDGITGSAAGRGDNASTNTAAAAAPTPRTNAQYHARRANSLGPNAMRRLRDAYLASSNAQGSSSGNSRRRRSQQAQQEQPGGVAKEEDGRQDLEGYYEQEAAAAHQEAMATSSTPPQLEDQLHHMFSSQDLEKQQYYLQNQSWSADAAGAGTGGNGYRSHNSSCSNLDLDQTPGAYSVPGVDADSSSSHQSENDHDHDHSFSGGGEALDNSDANDTLTTFTSNLSLGLLVEDEHHHHQQQQQSSDYHPSQHHHQQLYQQQQQQHRQHSPHHGGGASVANQDVGPIPPLERGTRRRPSSPVLAIATAILVDSDDEDNNSTNQRQNHLARKQLELAEREEQLARQAAKLKAWEEQLEQQRLLMEQQAAQVMAQQQTQTQSQVSLPPPPPPPPPPQGRGAGTGPASVVQASQVINLSSSASSLPQPLPSSFPPSSAASGAVPPLPATSHTRTAAAAAVPTTMNASAATNTTSSSSASARRPRLMRVFRSGRGENFLMGNSRSTEQVQEQQQSTATTTTATGTRSLDRADLASLAAQIAAGNAGTFATGSSGNNSGPGSSFLLTGSDHNNNNSNSGHMIGDSCYSDPYRGNNNSSITTAVVSRVLSSSFGTGIGTTASSNGGGGNNDSRHYCDYGIPAQVMRVGGGGSSITSAPGVVMDENLDLALARAELGDGPLRFAPPTPYHLEQVLSRLSSADRKAYQNLKERWENRRAKQMMKFGKSSSKKKPLDLPMQWHLRYLHLCAKQHKRDHTYYFSVEKAWNSERKVQRRFLSLNIYKMENQIQSKTLFPVPGLKTSGGHDMFYMRPSRYFPNRTSVKTVIDNQQYVMDVMLQNNEFAQKEGIGFVACMDDWKMRNFDVNYCFQFMMGLQGFMCPVKTQLFLIVNPPSWFGAIWKIMKPMLAPSFRKRVKIVPEKKIAKYLAPGYQQYLPDDMQTGMADTDAVVADFIAYRKYVERDSILFDYDDCGSRGRPDSDAGQSVAPSDSHGDDSHDSNLQVPSNFDYSSMHSLRMTRSLSSRSPSVSSGMSLSGSGSGGSLGCDDDDDDGASIHCDINDDELLENEDMKQAATPEEDDPMYFDPALYYG